jgi:hypothetical protein
MTDEMRSNMSTDQEAKQVTWASKTLQGNDGDQSPESDELKAKMFLVLAEEATKMEGDVDYNEYDSIEEDDYEYSDVESDCNDRSVSKEHMDHEEQYLGFDRVGKEEAKYRMRDDEIFHHLNGHPDDVAAI